MRRLLIPVLLAACSSPATTAKPFEATRVDRGDRAAPVSARAVDTCDPGVAICWTTTPRLDELAAYHRAIAAERRAASPALAAAEARACVTVAPIDRDLSPFSRIEDIATVTPLEERSLGKLAVWYTAGATITFRQVPGLSVENLQAIVDCQLARNVALAHDRPELPNCPLVPAGALAQVRAVADGFAIDVRAEDDATANAILERAERLRPIPSTVAFGR